MDSTEEKYQQLKSALENYPMSDNTETKEDIPPSLFQSDRLDFSALDSLSIQSLTTAQISTIDLSSLNSLGSISPNVYTITGGSGGTYAGGGGGGGGSGGVYISPNTMPMQNGTTTGWTYSNPYNGTVKIHADDLEINGKSVMKTLERIEIQLGLLDHDDKLEQDWKELRDLGDKYRRAKKRIEDKLETFNRLKK